MIARTALGSVKSMGLFDWLGRRGQPPEAPAWEMRVEGGEVIVEDGKRIYRFSKAGARSVRIVPLGAGGQHAAGGGPGWQVAVRKTDGDVPIGRPLGSWQHARALATRLCETSGLELDELTQRMFSQVGTYTPPPPPQ
jgi:hypothetical protein